MKTLLVWFTICSLFLLPSKLLAQYTLEYSTNGSVITLTGYTGTPVSVSIPSGVTAIGTSAFIYCSSMTSITIPNTVTAIGSEAFYDCDNLTGISIPNSVTNIGYFAFFYCTAMTSVSIGSGVTSIQVNSFYNCSALTSFTVVSSNLDYSSLDGVLFNQNQTTLVAYPGGLSGSYTIPNTVTSIGQEAFLLCGKLTSLAIPSSVTSCGEEAFTDCGDLTSFTVSSQNPDFSSANGVLFNQNQTALVAYPGGLSGSYTISNTVTSIGEFAFYECPGLTGITIPGSVTSIAALAFANCPGLTSVTIPDSVTGVGDQVFYDCTGLTSVTIGNGITTIPEEALTFCSKLTSLTLSANVTTLGYMAFAYDYDLTSVYFQGSAPGADATAFESAPTTAYYLYGTQGWSDFTADTGVPAVLLNPPFSGLGVQNKHFGFTVSGPTNSAISAVVEACTNLANPVWLPLQTNTLDTGSFYFSDPAFTNFPARYYQTVYAFP